MHDINISIFAKVLEYVSCIQMFSPNLGHSSCSKYWSRWDLVFFESCIYTNNNFSTFSHTTNQSWPSQIRCAERLSGLIKLFAGFPGSRRWNSNNENFLSEFYAFMLVCEANAEHIVTHSELLSKWNRTGVKQALGKFCIFASMECEVWSILQLSIFIP